MVIIRMSSELYGSEEFKFVDWDEALEGIRRLFQQAASLDDGVERSIGVIVNGESDDSNS